VWVAPKDAEDAKEKLWRSSKESAVAQIVADEESPDEGHRTPFWEIDTEATARLTSWRVEMSKKATTTILPSLVVSKVFASLASFFANFACILKYLLSMI
jgi:hypothetical protein